MKYSISYFYQIRFFKPYQIPVSTALWDPQWFHSKESLHLSDDIEIFLDKNNVINGFRMKALNPTTSECANGCKWKGQDTCPFKEHYLEHLRSLDFEKQIGRMSEYVDKRICSAFDIDRNKVELVFIVYEAPDNPCSERSGLIQWFKENGIELKEWRKDE